MIEIIGYLAAICTTIAFVPQVYRIYKTKSANDVSLLMFSIFSVGVVLWLYYGFTTNNAPVIAANGITLFFSIAILYFKMKYGLKK